MSGEVLLLAMGFGRGFTYGLDQLLYIIVHLKKNVPFRTVSLPSLPVEGFDLSAW